MNKFAYKESPSMERKCESLPDTGNSTAVYILYEIAKLSIDLGYILCIIRKILSSIAHFDSYTISII